MLKFGSMDLIRFNKTDSPNKKITDTYRLSEIVKLFSDTLRKKNNYPRIVRRYLEYCLKNSLPIGKVSLENYSQEKPGSIVSPLRKFVRFAAERNIRHITHDLISEYKAPAENELILAFIRDASHLRAARSRNNYTKALNAFFKYLQEQDFGFNKYSVDEFIRKLIKEEKSPFTINLYLSVIKQMSKWLVRSRFKLGHEFTHRQLEDLRDVESIKNLPVKGGYYKDSLTRQERSHLLQSIKEPYWQSICALMAYCGLRTIEITRLRIMDLDLENSLLQVKGKGKYQYETIRLFASCQPYLQAWLQERLLLHNTKLSETDFLFPAIEKTLSGYQIKADQLNSDQVRYKVKKLMVDCGLKRKKLSVHSLRHTAAQLLIDQDVEAIYVQQQLRHSSLDTTNKYILKKLHEKFLDKIPYDN